MSAAVWAEEFSGKCVVLSGGSGQIGAVIGAAYVAAGARVASLDLVAPESVDAARSDTGPASAARPLHVRTDITSATEVEAGLDRVSAVYGSIDILINCAGIGVFTPMETRTVAEFDAVMDVNLKGTFLMVQAVARGMQRRASGVIVNVGSIYGVSAADQRIYGDSGRNSSEVYAMTKAGVIHFTRYMARYLAPHGIRVNCVSPGGIFADQDPAFVANYVHKTPLGRMGNPEDLVGGIFYLTSSLSQYVTGQNLIIDGGFTIGD